MKSNSNIQAAALNPSFLLFVALPGMHARAADRLAAEKKKRTVAAEEKRSREEVRSAARFHSTGSPVEGGMVKYLGNSFGPTSQHLGQVTISLGTPPN